MFTLFSHYVSIKVNSISLTMKYLLKLCNIPLKF